MLAVTTADARAFLRFLSLPGLLFFRSAFRLRLYLLSRASVVAYNPTSRALSLLILIFALRLRTDVRYVRTPDSDSDYDSASRLVSSHIYLTVYSLHPAAAAARSSPHAYIYINLPSYTPPRLLPYVRPPPQCRYFQLS